MSKVALVIGASGVIGNGVAAALEGAYKVVRASRSSGDVNVDVTSADSIKAMFEAVGKVDHVCFCAGSVPFKPLANLTRADFQAGLMDKLMGQVEVVQQGTSFMNDGGSFTLMSGVLARDPIVSGCVASMVNGAIESFVVSAAIELPRRIRINVVSPSVLVESVGYHPFFPGFKQVPLCDVVQAYVKSVGNPHTGRVYRAE